MLWDAPHEDCGMIIHIICCVFDVDLGLKSIFLGPLSLLKGTVHALQSYAYENQLEFLSRTT